LSEYIQPSTTILLSQLRKRGNVVDGCMYSLKAWPSKAKQSLDHVDWTVVTREREHSTLVVFPPSSTHHVDIAHSLKSLAYLGGRNAGVFRSCESSIVVDGCMYSLKAWPSKAKQSLDHVDWIHPPRRHSSFSQKPSLSRRPQRRRHFLTVSCSLLERECGALKVLLDGLGSAVLGRDVTLATLVDDDGDSSFSQKPSLSRRPQRRRHFLTVSCSLSLVTTVQST
jgi:hypothetical protein